MSAQSDVSGLKQKIQGLKAAIERQRDALFDADLFGVSSGVPSVPNLMIRSRRILKGHLSKVYAIQCAPSRQSLVSASQDGKLLIWDVVSANKLNAIPLRSSWVTTCAYGPDDTFVACGGLDNVVSIYNLRTLSPRADVPAVPSRELSAHSGYISCCRFVNDKILSSSGDNTCMLWDIELGKRLLTFDQHGADVMSISVAPTPEAANLFVSGACDSLAKLWDMRSGACEMTFAHHSSDVNAVAFCPDGQSFVTGSDDRTCGLFDLRSSTHIATYALPEGKQCVTTVAVSRSGRYLIAGYDDCTCLIWDILKGNKLCTLAGHDNRISCADVLHDGSAICTGSWDTTVRVWA